MRVILTQPILPQFVGIPPYPVKFIGTVSDDRNTAIQAVTPPFCPDDCLSGPDVHPVYVAFAEHWDFTPLPTRPRNPREAVCRAAAPALEHRLFRYKDLHRLAEQARRQERLALITEHPSIRSLDHYRLEEWT